MNKNELKDYCLQNLNYEAMGYFCEYAQFCEETLFELIPYLNTEGLKVLKARIDSIKEQTGTL